MFVPSGEYIKPCILRSSAPPKFPHLEEPSSACSGNDVKRGHNLEAETVAEAKTEAKEKVMNKKYQMMIDNIQLNLHNHDLNNTLSFLILSHLFSLSSIICPFTLTIVRCPVVANWSVSSWLLVRLL